MVVHLQSEKWLKRTSNGLFSVPMLFQVTVSGGIRWKRVKYKDLYDLLSSKGDEC